MIKAEDIYRASNGGLDIILYYYPQASECVNNKKHFKRRPDEDDASACIKRSHRRTSRPLPRDRRAEAERQQARDTQTTRQGRRARGSKILRAGGQIHPRAASSIGTKGEAGACGSPSLACGQIIFLYKEPGSHYQIQYPVLPHLHA